MVINHSLTGMILQVEEAGNVTWSNWEVREAGSWALVELAAKILHVTMAPTGGPWGQE